MVPRLVVLSLMAAGVAPFAVAAQDATSRAVRTTELAAAHSVAVDSQSAIAARWRAVAPNAADARLAAFGLASLSRLLYASDADRMLSDLTTGSDAVARRAMLARAQLVAGTGRWAAADTLYAAAALRASAAHDSILEADADFGRYAVTLARFNSPAARVNAARADSVRPASDVLLAAASACARAALSPSDSALRAATALADRAGDPRLAAACLNPLPALLFGRQREDSADAATSQVIARDRRTRDRSALANALMFRCYRRLTLYDYGRSAADCQEAIREGLAIGSPYAVGWAELNLGALSHLVGDDAAARIHNARARAALSSIPDNTGLGILRRVTPTSRSQTGTPRPPMRRLWTPCTPARPGADAGGAWSRLAAIALTEGRYDDARRALDSDVAVLARGHAENFIPATSLRYGAILLRQGRPNDALAQLRTRCL